jgi:hypothetical protein
MTIDCPKDSAMLVMDALNDSPHFSAELQTGNLIVITHT